MSDVVGQRQSLDARLRDAKGFYGRFAALLAVAGIVTILPGAPLGIITLAVQAMCGLMLPSTTIFVLLLSNDREILGPWVNSLWLNICAVVVVAALTVLSVTMMVSTLFTSIKVLQLLEVLSVAAAAALVIGLPVALLRRHPPTHYAVAKKEWRMPRLSLVASPTMSSGRRWLLRILATYLVVAGTMLVVRVVQLMTS